MQQLGKVVSEVPGRRFVIPDIHGCNKTLEKLWSKIDPQKYDQVFFLGDYVNKGKNSRKVLDFLISLKDHPCDCYFLRGNHDQKLLDFYSNSGSETEEELRAFNTSDLLDIEDSLKAKYEQFLSSTEFFIISGSYILVHAGLDFKLNNPFRDKESMMNVRGFTYDSKKAMGKSIIHGHFPLTQKVIKEAFNSRDRIIPLDNGCVYTDRDGMGSLLCIELNSWTLFTQENIDN